MSGGGRVRFRFHDGPGRLATLQKWLIIGWVNENTSLGVYDKQGRRQRRRFYTLNSREPHPEFEDTSRNPFPPKRMMLDMAAAILRNGLGRTVRGDEGEWPKNFLKPPQTLNHVIVDVMMHATKLNPESDTAAGAFARYERLQTVERWQKSGRIDVSFHVNDKRDQSTAVVTFGQHERREHTEVFPSPEMIANIALALDAGADQ
jgi:hypothetical protein